jgi:hypothetical protein
VNEHRVQLSFPTRVNREHTVSPNPVFVSCKAELTHNVEKIG